MDAPPSSSPPPVEQWVPLYENEAEFAAAIREGDVGRKPEPGDLEVGAHAIRCQQCQNLLPIEPCRHCGGRHFVLRRTAYGQVALHCRACTRMYDRTACTCGTVVPLSHKVLTRKVLLQPVPPGTILRWAIIAFACLVGLVLLIKLL